MTGLVTSMVVSTGLRKGLAYAGGLALAAGLVWGLWARGGHYKAKLASAEHQITLEVAAHRQTKAAYRTAQAQAAKAETARLVRVKDAQQRITANVSQDYTARLTDLRARYDSLRHNETARACAFGTACGKSVPTIPGAPGGTTSPPDEAGLSLAERYLASQQAEQLDALITWVVKQGEVSDSE